MTLQDLMRNPTGPGSAQFAGRKAIIGDLSRRLSVIAAKNEFETRLFTGEDDEGPCEVWHVRVPSETLPASVGFKWDVVIRLAAPSELTSVGLVRAAEARVFSNNPSFVFTYANAALKNEVLFEKLARKKLSKKAIDQAGSMRNPSSTMGFEKSIWFAMAIIVNDELYKRPSGLKVEKFDWKKIFSRVEDFDKISERYEYRIGIEAKKRQKERKEERRQPKKKPTRNRSATAKQPKKSVNKAKKTSTVRKVKKARKVGSSRRGR